MLVPHLPSSRPRPCRQGTWLGPQCPSASSGVLSGTTSRALGWRPQPLPPLTSAPNRAQGDLGDRLVENGSVWSPAPTRGQSRTPASLARQRIGELVVGLWPPQGIFSHPSASAFVLWGITEGGNQPTSSFKS